MTTVVNGKAQTIYYANGSNGYGFYYNTSSISEETGLTVTTQNQYTGTDQRVKDVDDALARIGLGDVGRNLVDDLMSSTKTTHIVKGSINNADQANGNFINWNPNGKNSAPDVNGSTNRPSYIGLAHEMAHVQDIWNGTINLNTWKTIIDANGNTSTIPNAELYSTHIENKIRSENGVPLRAFYATTVTGMGEYSTRIIKAGTRQSMYYLSNGSTNYTPITSKQTPYTY